MINSDRVSISKSIQKNILDYLPASKINEWMYKCLNSNFVNYFLGKYNTESEYSDKIARELNSRIYIALSKFKVEFSTSICVFRTKDWRNLCSFCININSNITDIATFRSELWIYDLQIQQIVKTIELEELIYNNILFHYYDKFSKKDFLIFQDSNKGLIKILDLENNYEIYSHINIKAKFCSLFSCDSQYKSLVLTAINQFIVVFTINSDFVKEISTNNEVIFLDTIYDKQLDENVVVIGNKNCITLAHFDNFLVIKTFCILYNMSNSEIFVKFNLDKVICLTKQGILIIWNYYTEENIFTHNFYLNIEQCIFWNDDYVFALNQEKNLELLNITNQKLEKTYDNGRKLLNLTKLYHPLYGPSILSLSSESNATFKYVELFSKTKTYSMKKKSSSFGLFPK